MSVLWGDDEYERRVEIPQARELGLANRKRLADDLIAHVFRNVIEAGAGGLLARCVYCHEPAVVTTADRQVVCDRCFEGRER